MGSIPDLLAWAMIASGAATLITELAGIAAPYGRYQRKGWGFYIPARVAWVTQELPSLLVPLGMLLRAGVGPFLQRPAAPRSLLAAALLAHYAQRSLLYPLLIRAGKPTPAVVWAMAAAFCCWNGYLQGDMLLHRLPAAGPWSARQLVGLALWLVGWLLNLHSDHLLRTLRRTKADAGYHIPRGGCFEYVSAANYTAEILEWSGYALAAWRLPAAAFAWFTFCNLAPRGLAHHQWYRVKFGDDYPQHRKAVIPFVW